MRDAASSPTVSLENENFREAETWEYAVSMPGEVLLRRVGLCIGASGPMQICMSRSRNWLGLQLGIGYSNPHKDILCLRQGR